MPVLFHRMPGTGAPRAGRTSAFHSRDTLFLLPQQTAKLSLVVLAMEFSLETHFKAFERIEVNNAVK